MGICEEVNLDGPLPFADRFSTSGCPKPSFHQNWCGCRGCFWKISLRGRTNATWAVDVSPEKWGWALWDPLWPFFTIFGRTKIHRFVLENTNLSAMNIYFSWWMFFPIQAGPTVPDWDPWRDQRSWLFLKWDQWNMGNIEQWNKHKNNHHVLTEGTNTLWKSVRFAGKSPFGIVYWVSQHLKTCI